MTRTTPPLTSDSTNAIGMPPVGFGTYQMSVEQAEQSVAEALKVGFRHIDSAQGYNNEVGTGNALKASGVPREELFVTTKLFPGYSAWGAPEKTFEDTIASCEQSLKELQLDYVDLYLIHLPSASTRLEQYKALVKLQKMGKVRHIGVSNYDVRHLQELEAANLPTPAVNQVEFHPLCAQAKLTPYMLERKILPVAYSSLATMSDWRAKQGQGGDTKADEKGAAQALQQELCQKLSVNEAQLLLRWGLQRGYAVLTKSTTPSRIASNRNVFGFEISPEDMERLNALDQDNHIAWAQQNMNPQNVDVPLKV